MANQIGPDDHNVSDWFRSKWAAPGTSLFSVTASTRSSKRWGNCMTLGGRIVYLWLERSKDANDAKKYQDNDFLD